MSITDTKSFKTWGDALVKSSLWEFAKLPMIAFHHPPDETFWDMIPDEVLIILLARFIGLTTAEMNDPLVIYIIIALDTFFDDLDADLEDLNQKNKSMGKLQEFKKTEIIGKLQELHHVPNEEVRGYANSLIRKYSGPGAAYSSSSSID
jgi:hypothetical protein